jgi:hypothetical protein
VSQLDFFRLAPDAPKRAHVPSDFVAETWSPPEGTPEFRAVYAMVHYVSYTRLNAWQAQVLWPWLSSVRDEMRTVEDRSRRMFMVGYVVGALEVEQLRNRTDAAAICADYGVQI